MRHLKLIIPVIVVLTGLLLVPPPALASPENDGCQNTLSQYYRPLIPFFNTNLRQLTLVDPEHYPYRVVQVLADSVDVMGPLDYDSSWSPSCRYFAFSVGSKAGTDTIIWDTVNQKRASIFHRPGQFDPPYLDWSGSDDYAVAENYAGEFLWKIATNEQLQLNDLPMWYFETDYTWDIAHGQTLMFDGSYVVAFDLATGKAIRKYPSPFQNYMSNFQISPDGRTLRLTDQYYNKWSITFDRSAGKVIDAHAVSDLPAQDVQFSPDRHYLIIGGADTQVFDAINYSSQNSEYGWYAIVAFPRGYYTWRFINPTTFELDFTRTGQRQQVDLTTGNIH